MIPQCVWHGLTRGHGMGTGWELFECTACLLAREIGKENCDGEIVDVLKKYDCGVPGMEI